MDCFDNFSILAWNICGTFGRSSKRQVCDVVRLHHPSLFCVFETHGLFNKSERMWSSLSYKPLFIQEARGYSRGIWVLSSVTDIFVSLVDICYQMITFATIHKGQATWVLLAVYASPLFSSRCELWEKFKALRNNISSAWLLIGDFNEVSLSNEVFLRSL